MSEIPGDLKYTKSHEWMRVNDDGTISLGITDHAQGLLGDLVFVELPEVGQELNAGDGFAVVESVKAASDVYAPVAGTVRAVNDALTDRPELINESPYGDGYIATLETAGDVSLDGFLDADAYSAVVEEE